MPPPFSPTTIRPDSSAVWATCWRRGRPSPTSMTSSPSSLTGRNRSRQNRTAIDPGETALPFLAATRFRFATILRAALAALLLSPLWASAAHADFRLCNNTGSRVGVALGYKDKDGWVTEGWWNVPARSCETLLNGALVGRYYYIYAIDYDRGGEWSGRAFMCSREKEFTIRGTDDC